MNVGLIPGSGAYPSDLCAVLPSRPAPHCAGSDGTFTEASLLLTLFVVHV